MPNRTKRLFEEFDPTKSDPEDSDYDASTSRPARNKASRLQRGKPLRKRPKPGYGADGSEDISESEVGEESFEDDASHDEPEPEVDTRGRPVRQAKKKQPAYKESDGDSEEFLEEVDSATEDQPPRKRQKTNKSLILKLNIQKTPPDPVRRSTRARSSSLSSKRPLTADMASGATRRSSRIAHDETETVVKLTDSGRHVDIVRPGTRSPEGIIQRATRGGKGLKHPPASVIPEESEGSSLRTKDDPENDTNQHSFLGVDPEIAASREDLTEEVEIKSPQKKPDTQNATRGGSHHDEDEGINDPAVIPESGDEDEEEEEDAGIFKKPRRLNRRRGETHQEDPLNGTSSRQQSRILRRALRSSTQGQKARGSQKTKKGGRDESSDFEPGPEEGAEENISDSEDSGSSPRKASQPNDDDSSSNPRTSGKPVKTRASSRRRPMSEGHDSEVAEELAEELEDLRTSRPRRNPRQDILFDDRPQTRKRKPVDYRILRPDLAIPMDDDGPPSAITPSKRGRGGVGGTWQRSLFSTYGPFGGAGGPPPVFGGPGGVGAAGGVDSDSSEDDNMQRPRASGLGGTIGMTPTSAVPPGFGPFPSAQNHNSDPVQGPSGTPANLGKIKDRQALADADPLGVDQNVNFDGVGGLQGHIDQLKEMVALPLLYPEVFQRFHVTPPRGVLFHGPPGTGKTLLARALASSVSSQGRKVTFYMRKGADALSKWVGEAERQLRLLFEEARKTQPSIIFFDEIDGLAPVRSSKQEQIHASIVSTLLALMDGMDGRGQVIVIGATNRPDSIDPALRRPGRFDREFYFPLPNTEARRAILDIHTKGWEPPLSNSFKSEIADLTKGYGGADLRALCTEAALNAVQRIYPQIYKSNEKLQIKPETINVTAKDFMISVKKIIPSSERSVSSGAAPLPKSIEPLLRYPLIEIKNIIEEILPQKKPLTALEEAEFEDAEGDRGMRVERMQQEFERSRIFRPRLLIRGQPGMGQQYLAAALLNHFEGLHVQAFDLPTLLSDSTRSPEAAIVQLFTEVRRHKPSVIYIPNVDTWYRTVGDTVISTFLGLLRSLAPAEPVLVLGVLDMDENLVDKKMVKDLFGFSKRNQFHVLNPQRAWRREYFSPVIDFLNTSPEDFPEPTNRKKRVFEKLLPVPPEPPKPPPPPTKEELKAQKKKDRQTLNVLKLRIQPIMDQIRTKHKKFRTGVVDESQIRYLYDEEDPSIVSTDLPQEQRQAASFRPYEKGVDENGEPGLIEQATNKFIYNMEIVTIEKRLSNGYYKRPKDFLADVKKMTKDAKTIGDQERLLKANELQANVEVDIGQFFDISDPLFTAECEAVWLRETKRERDKIEKARRLAEAEGRQLEPIQSNVPPGDAYTSTEQSSGPIVLGQLITNGIQNPITPIHPAHPSQPTQSSSLPSNLTNGFSHGLSDLSGLHGNHQSNGTSVPSREDIQMTNSEDQPSTERETQGSSFGPSAQTRPLHSYTGGPASLQQRLSYPHSLSQRSAITPLAEGSNPNMYTNDASTTSSDKRVSGSSGPFNTQSTHNNTNNTNVTNNDLPHEGPNFGDHDFFDPAPGSQFPETQGTPPDTKHPPSSGSQQDGPLRLEYPTSQSTNNNSSSQSQPSQPPAVPPFPRPHASGIHSLLNASPPPSTALAVVPPGHPPLVKDLILSQGFLEELVMATTACSVEQLEQVYSALMGEIWQTRGSWDRVEVVNGVRGLLVELLEDMRWCQDFGEGSLGLEG